MRLFMPMVFIVAAGTLATALGTVWLGYVFHQFEEIEEAGALACQPVVGITGAYDVAAVPNSNVAFLSVYDERDKALRGEIVRFDFDNPLDDTSWRDRTRGRPVVFKPGGIDLYEERLPSGALQQRLFVVNHAGPEILAFDIDETGNLVMAGRFDDDRLTSPNDLVATGLNSFYVTNDTAAGRQSVQGKAEFLLGLATGSVLHFDGDDWDVAVDGLKFPNGIAIGPDGLNLYVAEMRGEALKHYIRDLGTDALEFRERIPLGSFPNNLSVAADGSVLVGAVPQPFAYKAFTAGLNDTAPSQVLKITSGVVETLFQDTGRKLSAASSAAQVGDRTVIGSAGDRKFLMCPNPTVGL